jgi:hypothetical protein
MATADEARQFGDDSVSRSGTFIARRHAAEGRERDNEAVRSLEGRMDCHHDHSLTWEKECLRKLQH